MLESPVVRTWDRRRPECLQLQSSLVARLQQRLQRLLKPRSAERPLQDLMTLLLSDRVDLAGLRLPQAWLAPPATTGFWRRFDWGERAQGQPST